MKEYLTGLFVSLGVIAGVCPELHAQGATGPLAEIAPVHQGILINFEELEAYKALATGRTRDVFYAEEGEHPALIKAEGLIPNPLGKYYLYHSPHDHDGTGLLYADNIEGPWTEYKPNGEFGPLPTIDNPKLSRETMHACPDVRWMEEYGEFFLWAHENNDYTDLFRSKDGITWKFDSTAIHRKNVHPNAKNATYTRCHKYPVERGGVTYKYIMVYSSAIKGEAETVRSVWLAYSHDALNWIQETEPLVSPIPAESKEGAAELAMFGPDFIRYKGRNYITYQGNLSGKSGKLRYVELDQNLTPVGTGGTRYLLIDPELVSDDPHMNKGKSFRGSQLILDGHTLYCTSRGGADRDFFYAKKEDIDPAKFGTAD